MRRARVKAASALAIACLVVLVAAGCGGSSKDDGSTGGSSGDPTKVTFLYAGPKNDQGYNESNVDFGAQLEEELGDEVEVTHADNVPYTEEAGKVAEQLIASGTDLIVDTAVYGEPVDNVCRDHPEEVSCLTVLPLSLVGEGELGPNMAGYYPEWWSSEFVMGAAAGLMTETNVVGGVNPLAIPLTNAYMNPFMLGCLHANPKCKMRLITINSYFDPPAASQAADTLADAGADVITGWVNDGSPCVAANERGLYAVGHYYDYSASCPDAILGTVMWSGPAYGEFFVDAARSVHDGSFEEKYGGQVHTIKFGQGAEAKLSEANLPPDVFAELEDIAASIEDGTLNPVTGPIKDNKGQLKVKAGEEFDLANPLEASPSLAEGGMIYGWDWQVEGIVGG